MELFIIIITMIAITFVGAVGSIFLKLGSNRIRSTIDKKNIFNINTLVAIIKNWRLILGVFLYGLTTIVFVMMLRSEDLSLLYPLTSMGYIFVTILSVFVLKEDINRLKILGILAIIAGVVLVTM